MSEEKKPPKPLKSLAWFKEVVENVPRGKGESFTDKIVDIQAARVISRAGEVALNEMGGKGEGPSAERGVSQGLENAGRKIVENKLLAEDPISSKVLGSLGDYLADALKEKLAGGGGLQGEDARELADRRRADELGLIVGKIRTELIEPMALEVKTLAAKIEAKPESTPGALTEEDAIDMVMAAQEKAKGFLKKQGYSVESVTITKEQVQAMLGEERTKQGERETKLKEDWEKERGATVEVEKERIRATETILTGISDRVMDLILVPIKDKIQEAIEKGAFKTAGG